LIPLVLLSLQCYFACDHLSRPRTRLDGGASQLEQVAHEGLEVLIVQLGDVAETRVRGDAHTLVGKARGAEHHLHDEATVLLAHGKMRGEGGG
jgi:hypothetical protein